MSKFNELDFSIRSIYRVFNKLDTFTGDLVVKFNISDTAMVPVGEFTILYNSTEVLTLYTLEVSWCVPVQTFYTLDVLISVSVLWSKTFVTSTVPKFNIFDTIRVPVGKFSILDSSIVVLVKESNILVILIGILVLNFVI